MRPLSALRRFFFNIECSARALVEIRDAVGDLSNSVRALQLQKDEPSSRRRAGPVLFDRSMRGDSDHGVPPPPSPNENRPENFKPLLDRVLAVAPAVVNLPGEGYMVDALGIVTDGRIHRIGPKALPAGPRQVPLPALVAEGDEHGEGYFELIDWMVAAEEAREQFVMISLGASYGGQLVGAYRALQLLNPLPAKLVAVEADPEGCEWTRRHFRDNGIDPDDHWIVQAAVSDSNTPVLFPIGAIASGAANCVSTNEPKAREIWIERIRRKGDPAAAFENLIRHGSTGLVHEVTDGFSGEVRFVSAVTLADLLANFERVDLLECDMQQSEIVALPPFLDRLRRKVKRLHIGTHGEDIHRSLHRLFAGTGWEVVFNYPPNLTHDTALGRFRTNDGILTVRNPDI
jgi:hypothetical protein